MDIVVDTPMCPAPGDNLTCEARSAEWCLEAARKVALPVGFWDAQPGPQSPTSVLIIFGLRGEAVCIRFSFESKDLDKEKPT